MVFVIPQWEPALWLWLLPWLALALMGVLYLSGLVLMEKERRAAEKKSKRTQLEIWTKGKVK